MRSAATGELPHTYGEYLTCSERDAFELIDDEVPGRQPVQGIACQVANRTERDPILRVEVEA
jgi:hypothetical protein